MEKEMLLITNCSIIRTMDALCGKWRLLIIYVLLSGAKRFKDLEQSIDGINTKMLVKELKMLEKNKIITRKAYAQVPPRVEYTLTEKGYALKNIIDEVRLWDKNYMNV